MADVLTSGADGRVATLGEAGEPEAKTGSDWSLAASTTPIASAVPNDSATCAWSASATGVVAQGDLLSSQPRARALAPSAVAARLVTSRRSACPLSSPARYCSAR